MRLNRSRRRRAQARGFSLIEVLVTMVITAAGLLGVAGLIVNSMRYNQTAGIRSITAEVAQDLAERMRANLAGLRAGDYAVAQVHADGLSGFQAPACYDSTAGLLNNCSADAVAQADLAQWASSTSAIVPSAGLRIVALANASPYSYRVIVGYRDRGATSASTCPNDYQAPNDVRCFIIDVSP